MSHTIILACGNPLRGDDGIALHLARCLQEQHWDPEIEIRYSQQWTPELAESISKADLAIFVDASTTVPAGTIRLQPVSSSKSWPGGTTHSLHPPQLLALARELYGKTPERALLLTIGGESFGHSSEFSRPVRGAIPTALAQIRRLASGVTLPEPDALPSAAIY